MGLLSSPPATGTLAPRVLVDAGRALVRRSMAEFAEVGDSCNVWYARAEAHVQRLKRGTELEAHQHPERPAVEPPLDRHVEPVHQPEWARDGWADLELPSVVPRRCQPNFTDAIAVTFSLRCTLARVFQADRLGGAPSVGSAAGLRLGRGRCVVRRVRRRGPSLGWG